MASEPMDDVSWVCVVMLFAIVAPMAAGTMYIGHHDNPSRCISEVSPECKVVAESMPKRSGK